MEVETPFERLAEAEAKMVVGTLVKDNKDRRLGRELKDDNLGDTHAIVKTEALVDALDERLKEVEVETLREKV